MALVILLRGVNVGGHKTFRPTRLVEQLQQLDVVNIGAAGTFVVRQPVTRTKLRAEFGRRLPFDAEIVICTGQEVLRLTSQDYFSGQPEGRDIVRFVSVLSRMLGRTATCTAFDTSIPTYCVALIVPPRDRLS